MPNNKKLNTGSHLINKLINDNGYTGDKKQAWSEVDELYNVLAHSLVNVASEVNKGIRLIQELGGTSNKELAVKINGFNNDINTFTSDLLEIKKRHEGKQGSIDPSSDDFVLCYSVYNDYVMLNDRFKALIFDPMLSVTEEIMAIAERKKAEQDLTDPNVVTDVEIIDKDQVNV